MNFKGVLAMLLALCLIVNMAVPGVSALTAGADNYVAGMDLTASENPAKAEQIHVSTLRDAVQPSQSRPFPRENGSQSRSTSPTPI